MKEALIIFQKNRVPGKVKTRLAATIGNDNALMVYEVLVAKAHENARAINRPVYLYFSDELEAQESWPSCILRVQDQRDLGMRMMCAMREVLEEGFEKVVLVGTDCYELTPEILESAFLQLNTSDYVLGPALDGGYYLIGGKRTDDSVFLDKVWSTATVCQEAIDAIQQLGLKVACVATLSDVDVEADLGELKALIHS